ncbi:hypothetical protein SDC9_153076 [bioreactor metagenome]|uniref:Uncharacterized protein n=1 Tax=bioreactor metagenome TaxID=1076179 RepID=A0A645EX63_9ZZZZ
MGVGIAGTGSGIADVDNADLYVLDRDSGAGSIASGGSRRAVAFASAAREQRSYHRSGAKKAKRFFHFLSSNSMFHSIFFHLLFHYEGC